MKQTSDGRRTVVVSDRDVLRKVSFSCNGEAYLEVGRAAVAIAETRCLPFAVTPERFDGKDGGVVYRERAGHELPVGTRKANFGTNHPGTPEREGQVGVFKSPYSHSSWLVDVAERDEAGGLRWVALPFEDPRYERAINAAQAVQSSLGRYRFRPLTSGMLADQYPVKGSMPQPVVRQLYQLRDAEVAALMRQATVTVYDMRKLDRGARAMVADLLYGKCDEAARYSLLHDEHSHVRACAAIASAKVERGLNPSTSSPAPSAVALEKELACEVEAGRRAAPDSHVVWEGGFDRATCSDLESAKRIAGALRLAGSVEKIWVTTGADFDTAYEEPDALAGSQSAAP